MKTKLNKSPVALALGTAFAASLVASSAAMAESSTTANPFAMSEMSSGYMQVSEMDKKSMEGKCGGSKAKKEGKCGEGKCGANKEMKKNMEGKCGGSKAKKEGKCGEGKCGSSKK